MYTQNAQGLHISTLRAPTSGGQNGQATRKYAEGPPSCGGLPCGGPFCCCSSTFGSVLLLSPLLACLFFEPQETDNTKVDVMNNVFTDVFMAIRY